MPPPPIFSSHHPLPFTLSHASLPLLPNTCPPVYSLTRPPHPIFSDHKRPILCTLSHRPSRSLPHTAPPIHSPHPFFPRTTLFHLLPHTTPFHALPHTGPSRSLPRTARSHSSPYPIQSLTPPLPKTRKLLLRQRRFFLDNPSLSFRLPEFFIFSRTSKKNLDFEGVGASRIRDPLSQQKPGWMRMTSDYVFKCD